MKNLYLYLCLALAAGNLGAQNAACDGIRYKDLVFNQVDTIKNVKFGQNTTIGGANKELFMDIYQPAGDTASERPAILLAFGGSFVSGNRQQLSGLCNYFARRGYVCSCIDYRLFDVFAIPDSVMMVDVVVRAVGDFKAAVRYLRQDAATDNLYRIDSDYIFAGGVSAGAIAADHMAYLDSTDTDIPSFAMTSIVNNGGWEGSSNNNTLAYSSKVQGVLNYSGALARSVWVSPGQAPLFSAHDDQDEIVPFGAGMAGFNLGFFTLDIVYMEGSELMHNQALQSGLTSELIVIPNSTGHVSYMGSATWEDTVLTSSTRFLQEITCSPAASVSVFDAAQYDWQAYPNPASGDFFLRVAHNPLQLSYDVRLFDPMGREVYQSMNRQDNELRIPRNALPAGIYYLQVRLQGVEQPLVRKVVLN